MIADNLRSVTQRIAASCAKARRPEDDVRLVVVTKKASVEEIGEAIASGARILGENRVQDAVIKHKAIGDRASWHLVGHLQTNKAREAVRIFSLIHSVDSIRLAGEIDKEAARIGKVQDVLVQVNVSGEKTKYGIEPAATFDLLKAADLYRNINICGLMTIAPESDDPELARPCFRALKTLRDEINGKRPEDRKLTVLSMGMSNDFEAAIEEGSNMVRIGRAVFR